MTNIFRAYYVWPYFPSFSMSGNTCALHCQHCNHTFLEDMHPLRTPQHLYDFVTQQKDDQIIGFLLSGGCDHKGRMLHLKSFLPIIKKIKQVTNLIIKLHTGLVDRTLAEEIVAAGVDIASVEVVGSDETIKTIFDFHTTTQEYQYTLEYLEAAGMPYIVPHICIGLHRGTLRGEYNALSIIKNTCNPSSLVMIVLWPTKGTSLANIPAPSKSNIQAVIQKAVQDFPKKEIALGCMRPRGKLREIIEIAALDAGVTRMEIPSKRTLHHAHMKGYQIKRIGACCALPTDLEQPAILPGPITHPLSP